MTRVRNYEDARFGEYLIKTWYYSPYPKPIPIEERSTSPTPKMAASTTTQSQNQRKRKLNEHDEGSGALLLSPAITNGIHVQNGKGGLKKERSVQNMFAASVGKSAEMKRGRLWVCDVSIYSSD